jgi:hypothetical protein
MRYRYYEYPKYFKCMMHLLSLLSRFCRYFDACSSEKNRQLYSTGSSLHGQLCVCVCARVNCSTCLYLQVLNCIKMQIKTNNYFWWFKFVQKCTFKLTTISLPTVWSRTASMSIFPQKWFTRLWCIFMYFLNLPPHQARWFPTRWPFSFPQGSQLIYIQFSLLHFFISISCCTAHAV